LGPTTPPAEAGRMLFVSYGCATCHGQTAPSLAGLYMSQVPLNDGTTVVADEDYLRRSIIDPGAQIVAGYPNIMPSYRGQITAEQLNAFVEYIKSLDVAKARSAAQAANDSSLYHQAPNLPPAQGRPQVLPPPPPSGGSQ
ncbi:MAG TPA: cytochrome c, partial [Rhizomicrobium sp.]|nr:cytochrome c [Rhizomicrobium sp.]